MVRPTGPGRFFDRAKEVAGANPERLDAIPGKVDISPRFGSEPWPRAERL